MLLTESLNDLIDVFSRLRNAMNVVSGFWQSIWPQRFRITAKTQRQVKNVDVPLMFLA